MTFSIGYLAYALERPSGGIGRYSRELLKALQKEGLDVTVLYTGQTKPSSKTVPLPGSGLLPGLMILGQLEIARAVRERDLALVHDPTGCMPLALAPARKVVTIHDAFPYIYPKTSTALEWLIYRFWLPAAARHADSVITVSRCSKNDIIHYLKISETKITVIPEGVDARFRPMSAKEIRPVLDRMQISPPYILYVGSLTPRKNLLRLLEAFAQFRQKVERWILVIVGAQNIQKSSPVSTAVSRLGLKPYVHITGYLPDEDLPALYNGADLFVFPSLYEGFGLPVLESMACGTPVITSNNSSLVELAGESSILVDPYSVQAIAEAMLQVISDSNLAASLRVKGVERAKGFTWERTARETTSVYQQVLDGKSKRCKRAR